VTISNPTLRSVTSKASLAERVIHYFFIFGDEEGDKTYLWQQSRFNSANFFTPMIYRAMKAFFSNK
jgi:hypothetical protein